MALTPDNGGFRVELASPITIYWDLPSEPADQEALQRICTDISECRPLMLQMLSTEETSAEGLLFVLQQLADSRIAVSVTIPVEHLNNLPGEIISQAGIKELLLYTESLSDLPKGAWWENRTESQTVTGISFSATRANWQQLPQVVSWCRSNGITRLVLPMQRLYNNETPFFISRQEQQELTDALEQVGGVEGLNLTIHDPFLWRAFNPAIPFPQAGCQAANTMIAIAPDGGVHPCPTLPVRLGSLTESSLKEIISSPLKKQFRRSLLEQPGDCRDCNDVSVCRGGCRGRGLALQGTLDGIDPACR